MPNHVKNVWKIKGIKTEEEKNYLLDKLTIVYKPDSKSTEERIIDFDLIIPEPRCKIDCPKEYRVNKDSHIAPTPDREWFDWYEWRLDHWGTKWGAYDGYTIVDKTMITFVFNTAWSFAEPVASELAKLGYMLDLRYADEDYGRNCGQLFFNPKATISKRWTGQFEKDLPDPVNFARSLWNIY